jgi:hypothetical protein
MMVCSVMTGMIELESLSKKPGDHLQKGTTWFPPLRAPLLDSLLLEDQFVKALLISYSRNLGMDSADNAKMNSDNLHRLGGEDREGDRDTEAMLGFVSGARLLIGLRGSGLHLGR